MLTQFNPFSGICVSIFLSLHKLLIAFVMLALVSFDIYLFINGYFFNISSTLPSVFFQ
jgi:hypothetical protein